MKRGIKNKILDLEEFVKAKTRIIIKEAMDNGKSLVASELLGFDVVGEIDLIAIPGVAFDTSGDRLGYLSSVRPLHRVILCEG